MQKVYIYKTKDGTAFDHQRDAIQHERREILKDVYANVTMSKEERESLINHVMLKIDDILEAFETAEVMDVDEE